MSFNRASYDPDTYKYNLLSSAEVGKYVLSRPSQSCSSCFFDDPSIRIQRQGNSKCQPQDIVDLDSHLKGRSRVYTKCATSELHKVPQPECHPVPTDVCCASGFKASEPTRMSNPPCTMREIGVNRWEWLRENPQMHALTPFDANVNYRLIVKDNHRPLLPNSDINASMPQPSSKPLVHEQFTYDEKNQLPFLHWMPADQLMRL